MEVRLKQSSNNGIRKLKYMLPPVTRPRAASFELSANTGQMDRRVWNDVQFLQRGEGGLIHCGRPRNLWNWIVASIAVGIIVSELNQSDRRVGFDERTEICEFGGRNGGGWSGLYDLVRCSHSLLPYASPLVAFPAFTAFQKLWVTFFNLWIKQTRI